MKAKSLIQAFKGIALLFALLCFTAAGCKGGEDSDPNDSTQELSNRFAEAQQVGLLEAADIDEASGLVASRSISNYFWTHNDSGGDPTLFLIAKTGEEKSRLHLNNAKNIDWEDIAAGPGPDANLSYLYIGDIGDNRAGRKNLTIYRLPEPDLSQEIPANQNAKNIETINYVYSNGARDAETLMVDPLTKDIYIVSKREKQVGLYVLPFPQSVDAMDTAEYLIDLPYTYFTGGEISMDGTEILIKDYMAVHYWKRSVGKTIQETLSGPAEQLKYESEPQGEAICFATDGSGYFTLSERGSKNSIPLLFYQRN